MPRRSRAREVVLQLLFQWDQNPTAMPRAAVERFAADRLLDDAELVTFRVTVTGLADGRLTYTRDANLNLRVTGQYGGQAVDISD